MGDQFKERIGGALLGDLLVELAKRKSVKDLLGEFDALEADDLVRGFVDAFEIILKVKSEEQRRAVPVEPLPQPAPVEASEKNIAPVAKVILPPVPTPPAQSAPLEAGQKKSIPATGNLPIFPPVPPDTVIRFRKSLDELLNHGLPEDEADEKPEPAPLPSVRKTYRKLPYVIADEDYLYIHGMGEIPAGEEPSPRPFMLEEKGIEDREFAFAFDMAGIRVFATKLLATTSTISKTGVLLLGKQESIRLRGAHESVLNELRAHGPLLPVEFGTVARGMDEIERLVSLNRVSLRDALDDLMGTVWWNLNVYALDALIADAGGADDDGRSRDSHVRRRTSEGRVAVRTIDIKSLERVLAKQKKIAEGVHAQLSVLANRSEVRSMIGLSGGSSEDWKIILEASYDIPAASTAGFQHAIIDLQYQHFLHEIMFALSGDREAFAFKRR